MGKRKGAVPYEFIQEVNKLSKDELTVRFLAEENDINALLEKKKKLKKVKDSVSEKDDDDQDEEIQKELSADDKTRLTEITEEIEALTAESLRIKGVNVSGEATEDSSGPSESEKDRKAQLGGYSDEIKRRKALRNYLYKQLNVAFQIEMVAEPQ